MLEGHSPESLPMKPEGVDVTFLLGFSLPTFTSGVSPIRFYTLSATFILRFSVRMAVIYDKNWSTSIRDLIIFPKVHEFF